MGIKSIKVQVAAIKTYKWGADTYRSLMDKIFGKPIDMEMNCPAASMYPVLFEEGRCALGEAARKKIE